MTDSSPPRDVSRFARDGTPYIVVGTVVASLAAYAFQMVGGRALGPAGFDPVSALLTVHFLVFTVLLLPVEQFEIRRVTLGRVGGGVAVGGVIAIGAVGAAAFALATRERFFAGDPDYALVAFVGVLTAALLALGRGRMAGMRRFRSYGISSAVTATLRVVLAVGFLAMGATGVGLGWALALGPAAIVLWRPFRRADGAAERPRDQAVGRFLSGFVLASAVSQVMLLAAPLLVGVLSDTPGLMSVVFVTFQLFRAPIVITQNLLARFLPPFTELAAQGLHLDLRRWAVRFGIGAAVVAPFAALAGWLLGPSVVVLLFGAEFEPAATVAALAAVGMVIAAASLLAGQVLVARGRTLLLAAGWAAGLIAAGLALLIDAGGADVRVARAFVVGEAAALAAIVLAAIRRESV